MKPIHGTSITEALNLHSKNLRNKIPREPHAASNGALARRTGAWKASCPDPAGQGGGGHKRASGSSAGDAAKANNGRMKIGDALRTKEIKIEQPGRGRGRGEGGGGREVRVRGWAARCGHWVQGLSGTAFGSYVFDRMQSQTADESRPPTDRLVQRFRDQFCQLATKVGGMRPSGHLDDDCC